MTVPALLGWLMGALVVVLVAVVGWVGRSLVSKVDGQQQAIEALRVTVAVLGATVADVRHHQQHPGGT